jgi:hypothetical protein
MLVVEGPDGAGKSTLARRLSMELGWPIAPKVVDSRTMPLTDMREWVEQNLEAGLQKTIFDRHRLISEPIYGPLLRGTMDPGFDDAWWLRRMHTRFRELHPMVIFCLPPLEACVHNITDDAENDAVVLHIEPIYWLYFNAAASWDSRGDDTDWSYVWDYTVDDFTGLMRHVRDWMFGKDIEP